MVLRIEPAPNDSLTLLKLVGRITSPDVQQLKALIAETPNPVALDLQEVSTSTRFASSRRSNGGASNSAAFRRTSAPGSSWRGRGSATPGDALSTATMKHELPHLEEKESSS